MPSFEVLNDGPIFSLHLLFGLDATTLGFPQFASSSGNGSGPSGLESSNYCLSFGGCRKDKARYEDIEEWVRLPIWLEDADVLLLKVDVDAGILALLDNIEDIIRPSDP